MTRLRPHIDAMIANTLIKLQINARTKSTIKATEYILKYLARNANLLEPEEVKKFISEAKTKAGKPAVLFSENVFLGFFENVKLALKFIRQHY